MRKTTILLTTMLLGACANAPDPEAAVPTCSSQAECEARMRAAATWVHLNRKLTAHVKTSTEELVETAMTMSPGNYLLIRIEKVPSGNGSYRIESTMYCAKKVACDPSPWEAKRRLNRYVNRAWKVVDMPQVSDRQDSDR